ncbi:MAG: hypothetical protein N2484_05535 [Clostridia bacterium]|nr:hypothetical protein [Clostridia bacterium]
MSIICDFISKVKEIHVGSIDEYKTILVDLLHQTDHQLDSEADKITLICNFRRQYGICIAEAAEKETKKVEKSRMISYCQRICPEFCPKMKVQKAG